MAKKLFTADQMPDIAHSGTPRSQGHLRWVGMSSIEVPIRLESADLGNHTSMAKVDAYVSLDKPDSKGIHMSRLFISLQEELEARPLGLDLVRRILDQFVASHKGMSSNSFVSVEYELPMKRNSLLSQNKGWRSYPCRYTGSLVKGVYSFKQEVSVDYSSTCPCSAALARQLIQKNFEKDFSLEGPIKGRDVLEWLGEEKSISATPHGQRSRAQLTVELDSESSDITPEGLVDLAESAVKTPVQAVVKREDEQEFARLNGSNLMFAEDAARLIAEKLDSLVLADYRVEVTHFESLHPHNAVAVATKEFAGA